MVWILAYLPLVPTLTELWGRHGLDCRTRKCTIVNNSGELNPKDIIGQITVILTMLLLGVFNAASYIRLKVEKSYLFEYLIDCMKAQSDLAQTEAYLKTRISTEGMTDILRQFILPNNQKVDFLSSILH